MNSGGTPSITAVAMVVRKPSPFGEADEAMNVLGVGHTKDGDEAGRALQGLPFAPSCAIVAER